MNNLGYILHFTSKCVNFVISCYISKRSNNQKETHCSILKSSRSQLQEYIYNQKETHCSILKSSRNQLQEYV